MDVNSIKSVAEIPFLPISFFKTHSVISSHKTSELLFKSSGTTEQNLSIHHVTDASIYLKSIFNCFTSSFDAIEEYCFVALLPSYLEKKNSSLIFMVDYLMQISKHPSNGYYLYNHEALNELLINLELKKQKTILFGVTYALLDFVENFNPKLKYVKIIETGGMKGRRAEWLKAEVHKHLKQSFSIENIASEYGMTEMLSQFYSANDGIFNMQNHAKVFIRDMYDPFYIHNLPNQVGCINIVDLANINSCSFIATDDIGKIITPNTFEILGRIDNSDIRGCNLLIS